MQSSQSSTDNENRRPRGDMYLRAEQRHQAEAAAARLTEILTPAVPAVYDTAAGWTPPAAPTSPPPALETLATTTSVAGGTDGLVAPPPSTAGLDFSFVGPPAPLDDAPIAPTRVAGVTPATNAVVTPADVFVAPSVVAGVVAPAPEISVAPVRIANAAPARVQRRALRSLVPASAFAVVALAALFAIAGTLWPSNPDTATPNAEPARAQVPGPATRPNVGAPASQGTVAQPAARGDIAAPASRGGITGAAAPGPAYAVATNSSGKVEPAGKPAVAAQIRRPDIAAPVRPSTPVQQTRPDVAPVRAAAVTPVHTASEGELRITSTPSGARVTVNGIGWGQTPLTLAHLPLGPKTVRVTQDGYASQQRVVDLRGDTASAAVHVALRRAE